jgi:hypothetical protein
MNHRLPLLGCTDEMDRSSKSNTTRTGPARGRHGLGAAVLTAVMLAASPVLAQGWWPWSDSEPERPPIPREPVYREPPPPGAQPPSSNWSTNNPICLRLEQRLVQEGQRSGQSRDSLPRLESEIRQVNRESRAGEAELNRSKCYDYFLFSKTLRRTPHCTQLSRQVEDTKRRLSELQSRRQQIIASSSRSYRDEIIRGLARNNCGANYVQEARRQNRGLFSGIWQDDEGDDYSGGWSPFSGTRSYNTYRTVCVRLCDGYYFPVSFSTLPSHFEQDAAACRNKCAAPVELFYYQNPGQGMDQSIAYRSQQPYTSLKTAFMYRKQLVKGCSCKENEYVAEEALQDDAHAASAPGWEARSNWEAEAKTP